MDAFSPPVSRACRSGPPCPWTGHRIRHAGRGTVRIHVGRLPAQSTTAATSDTFANPLTTNPSAGLYGIMPGIPLGPCGPPGEAPGALGNGLSSRSRCRSAADVIDRRSGGGSRWSEFPLETSGTASSAREDVWGPTNLIILSGDLLTMYWGGDSSLGAVAVSGSAGVARTATTATRMRRPWRASPICSTKHPAWPTRALIAGGFHRRESASTGGVRDYGVPQVRAGPAAPDESLGSGPASLVAAAESG